MRKKSEEVPLLAHAQYRGDVIEVPVKNSRGKITGYIMLYWAKTLGCYVSVPARED